MFTVLARLQPDRPQSPAPESPPASRSSSYRQAPVWAGAIFLALTGMASLLLRDAAPGLPPPLATIPAVAGWEVTGAPPQWVGDASGKLATATVSLRRDERALVITLFAPLSHDVKLTDSVLAPPDANEWVETGSERLDSCDAGDCIGFLHTRWRGERTGVTRHVFRTYAIGDFYTTSRFAIRLATGWHRLRRTGLTPRLIGATIDGNIDATATLAVLRAVAVASRNRDAG